jgi:hypothetical protein
MRGYKSNVRGYRSNMIGSQSNMRGYRNNLRGYKSNLRGFNSNPSGCCSNPSAIDDEGCGGMSVFQTLCLWKGVDEGFYLFRQIVEVGRNP